MRYMKLKLSQVMHALTARNYFFKSFQPDVFCQILTFEEINKVLNNFRASCNSPISCVLFYVLVDVGLVQNKDTTLINTCELNQVHHLV